MISTPNTVLLLAMGLLLVLAHTRIPARIAAWWKHRIDGNVETEDSDDPE